ncbi:periplasmic nitrate reductase chaperone NapD [Dyella jiangningensis]|uniref:chaperone NapD n=1 Tax=Dyella sp. AtDHG13 TaxID=1938897 RepID=UPI000884D744|nr:chaperone NapD [Dyella sp. AtDHG13]PXV61676.1 periplasmic nitrate reductase chaperone NapD [Dyella sp. AtDHG13]SDJ67566.1 periplasmic nitrate reductase chaperone NapD [Dyella jiangningensis]
MSDAIASPQGNAMKDEHHISSLVVLHRPDAIAALGAFVEQHAALDIAVQGDCRCVVVCETDSQRAVMDHIDALEALPGVINVSLIYHHVEPCAVMDDVVHTAATPQGVDA